MMGRKQMHEDETGASAAFLILSLFMIFAAAAVSIDAGALMVTRRGLAGEAEAAALAAAEAAVTGTCADSDLRAEAEAIIDTNDPDSDVDEFVVRRTSNCGGKSGYVSVLAKHPGALFFAQFLGNEAQQVRAGAAAAFGAVKAANQVRPIALCGTNAHYKEFVALMNALNDGDDSNDAAAQAAYDRHGDPSSPGYDASKHPVHEGAGVVHRVKFRRMNLDDCDLGGPSGNWGWLDFTPPAGGVNELNAAIRNGHNGWVDLGGPGPGDESCDDTRAGPEDCGSETGGAGNATNSALESITCRAPMRTADCPESKKFYIIVFDAITSTVGGGNGGGGNGGGGGGGNGGGGGGGANGGNASFHPAAFAMVVLRDFYVGTGNPNNDQYFDFEFLNSLGEGEIGPADPNPAFAPVFGIQLCGVDGFSNCG